jgi:D-arabinose 1-dehydrogenase-like Zn-dependent alcohol dehydrogenase
VPFVCACGACPECAAGDGQVCRHQSQPGFTQPGSFADAVALDHAEVNLVEVPEDLDAGAAALLGCRFATAYRGLVGRAGLAGDEWLVVIGCGGVGLSCVMIGRAIGARVVAVDVADDALAFAGSLGAGHLVRADAAGALDELRAVTGGGAHVSVDAYGSEAAAGLALRALRRRGRHVQIGLLAEDPRLPVGKVIGGELTVLGSHGMAAGDYPAVLDLVASGALRPDRLVTRRIPLEDAPAALAGQGDAPGVGATIVDVSTH